MKQCRLAPGPRARARNAPLLVRSSDAPHSRNVRNPTRRLSRHLLLILFVAASCKDPVKPVCDPCFTTAVVYGSVLDSAGSPVPDVHVAIDIYLLASCDGGWREKGVFPAPTDAAGRFGGVWSSLHSPWTARCFNVTVTPDSTAAWPTEKFLFRDSLHFRDEYKGEPRDSIRLDVKLGGGGGDSAGGL